MTTLVEERTIETFTHEIIEIPESLRLGDPEPGDCVFRILSQKDGDKRVVWNRRRIQEINDAKIMFDKLIAEGLVPYKVGTDGRATSEVMTEFDPYAQEVIFMPIMAVVGG